MIGINDDRIQKVYNNNEELIIESENDLGQLFVRPIHSGVKRFFKLTIITENGLIFDLKLLPKEKKESDTYVIYDLPEKVIPQDLGKQHEEAIIKLMGLMLNNSRVDEYDLIRPKMADRNYGKNIKVQPIVQYVGDEYIGYAYNLTNISRNPITIDEQRLSLNKDKAVTVLHKTLQPKQSTRLFVVRSTKGI